MMNNNNLPSFMKGFYPETTQPEQASTMTVAEVAALMEVHMSCVKQAFEMGRALRNDEIEQLRAENERLRLQAENFHRKEVIHHD